MGDGDRKYVLVTSVVVIVGIVVCCTWSASLRVERQVRQLQAQIHNLSSQMTHDVMRVSGTVDRVREDARWWTEPSITIVDMDHDQALVQVSWQVREFRRGSEVALNYSLSGSEFDRITADEIADGMFAVVIPVAIPLQPVVHMQKVHTTSTSARNEQATPVETIDKADSLMMTCYISVQDEDMLLVGDECNIDLVKLRYQLFSPLDVTLSVVDGRYLCAYPLTILTYIIL